MPCVFPTVRPRARVCLQDVPRASTRVQARHLRFARVFRGDGTTRNALRRPRARCCALHSCQPRALVCGWHESVRARALVCAIVLTLERRVCAHPSNTRPTCYRSLWSGWRGLCRAVHARNTPRRAALRWRSHMCAIHRCFTAQLLSPRVHPRRRPSAYTLAHAFVSASAIAPRRRMFLRPSHQHPAPTRA